MWIEKLNLNNFRNYSKICVELGEYKQIAILGLNAQGKSNLLESLYLLAFASSFRTANLTEMIGWGQTMASVEGFFSLSNHLPVQLRFQINKNGKRIATVNQVNQKKLADYIGYIRLVCFSSRDLHMLTGQPQERRQFMDLLLTQIYPRYYSLLQNYQRVLKQRNILLKTLKKSRHSHSTSFEQLELWETQLCQIGADIIKRRIEALENFQGHLCMAHARMSLFAEEIEMKYRSSTGELLAKMPLEDVEKLLITQIRQKRETDILKGYTSIGPHRDDLSFLLSGRELRNYGSQGQIRTTALALKMAEMQFLCELMQDPPLLLLDDVFSELDHKRQQALIEYIRQPGIQTFLTTTHLDTHMQRIFGHLAKIYYVSQGNIYV